jgi:hypothetical protein
MADKTPLRATYSGADPDGLAEYQAGETIPVANGGTGAISASAARTSLGLVIGTDVAAQGADIPNGTALDRVDYTSSAIDAHKIVPFFLDEPAHVSPSFNWQRAIRQTSWYAELGAPPTHGAFVIDASQNAINWIDLDSATLAVYMTFTSGGTNILTSGTIYGVAVKDFRLMVATSAGLVEIDFLQDVSFLYQASLLYRYSSDISDRDASSAYAQYGTASIVNSTVNSVAICRDPSGGVDSFGRPLHYWLVNTSATANPFSLYSPIDNAIYDGGDLGSGPTADALPCLLTADGIAGGVVNLGGNFYNWFGLSVDGVSADGWDTYNYFAYGSGGGSTRLPWNGTAESKGIAAVDNGTGGKVFIIGSTEGLMLVNLPNYSTGGHETAGLIWLTSTYATPYMKNTRVAAYPLDSVTDRSGNGNDLTNGGTTAFTGTSPFGVACAEFDGTDDNFTITIANSAEGNATYSLMFKSTSATNPAGVEYLFNTMRNGFNDYLQIYLTTAGYLVVALRDNTTAADNFTFSADVYDAQWHHVAIVINRTEGTIKAFLDGVSQIDSSIAATNNLQFDRIAIGASWPGSSNFFA